MDGRGLGVRESQEGSKGWEDGWMEIWRAGDRERGSEGARVGWR